MRYIIFAILILSISLNGYLLLTPVNKLNLMDVKGVNDTGDLYQKYPYLSQRVVDDFERDLIINFVELRTKLKEETSKYGENFAIYFEYLPTGTSIGINEKEEFYSASLLKVPTVMAYYYNVEQNNITDDPTLTIEKRHIDPRFGSLWQKGIGAKIPASEAIKNVLTESDNTAVALLKDKIDQEDYEAIYDGLDIKINIDQNLHMASINAKSYASILKALFFSSIISKENSNNMLNYLAMSQFKDKLPAGVPENIKIAHKISVFEDVEPHIYADCGIVYVPRRQYLLCMASRSDEATARQRMKTVSKMVYDFVSTAEKPK